MSGCRPFVLRILSLNANGIRQQRKRWALGGFVSELRPQPDACVFTEMHLFDGEVAAVLLDSQRYANHSCREPDAEQARGGVFILVKIGTPVARLDELPRVRLPLNGCSILVYLRREDCPSVRITGVYFSPAAQPTGAMVGC